MPNRGVNIAQGSLPQIAHVGTRILEFRAPLVRRGAPRAAGDDCGTPIIIGVAIHAAEIIVANQQDRFERTNGVVDG